MTYGEAYREGMQILKNAGIEAPANDAGVLLCYAAGCDRTFTYAHGDSVLEDGIQKCYTELLEKRESGYPLQYLTGVQEFMSLTFEVAPGILIPRQDTELLAETVIDFCKMRLMAAGSGKEMCSKGAICNTDRALSGVDSGDQSGCSLNILDMCTGSGCIAVSIAHYLPCCRVTAVDLIPAALAATTANAMRNGVSERISIISSDLFNNIPIYKFDAIVSNPPYIRTGDIEGLQREVKCFEPVEALDGGTDGLQFYRKIVETSPRYLKSGGILAFETGYDQASNVAALMTDDGRYDNIRVHKDLAGIDRVVTGEVL